MLYQVNPILSTVNTMPHFGLMDENLMSREEALLLRSRLHYRCGARRLRQGKLPAGVVTLYDALLSAMRWYILTSQLRRLAGDSKPEIDENLENERLVFALLRKDATLKDRLPDHMTRGLSFFGVSMPNFFLGFVLIWIFSIKLRWLPPMGKGGISHMILPILTMSCMSLSINTRLIRSTMLDNMHSRYVLYARARGLPESAVVGRHVLTNSLIPVITAIGMHAGELFGGAVIAESIFSWPGLGRFAVSAIYNRDYPVMQCFILIMTTIFVLMNLAVDICYAWLDPRIRLQGDER